MNLAQARPRTLTEKLLGDPPPDRLERAQRLRAFYRVPDENQILDRGPRRVRILALLRDGAMAVRAIAEALREDPGKIYNDLFRMQRDGLVLRQGYGTGTHSTLVWMLPSEDQRVSHPVEPRVKGCPDAERLLPHMRDLGIMRAIDAAHALSACRQRANVVLKYAMAEGWVEKFGAGHLARYRLTAAGKEKAA